MKRESILFYMATGKIYLYLLNSKKEYKFKTDTSLFFECGEISNVARCRDAITKIMTKMHFGIYYLKPNFTVLYNDVCWGDTKFLYRTVLDVIGFNEIKFVPLSKLISKIRDDENLVVSDGDYYTLPKRGEKMKSLKSLEFEPIMIGKKDDKHVHYADIDIIYGTFKSCFTKGSNYDMIDVGDDEC